MANSVQFSVLDRRQPLLFMTEFCRKKGISLLPYGTLAGGFLADKYVGKAAGEVKIDTVSKQKYGVMLKQLGG